MQNFLKFEEKFAYFKAIANYPTIRKLIKLQHLQYHYLIQMLIYYYYNCVVSWREANALLMTFPLDSRKTMHCDIQNAIRHVHDQLWFNPCIQ